MMGATEAADGEGATSLFLSALHFVGPHLGSREVRTFLSRAQEDDGGGVCECVRACVAEGVNVCCKLSGYLCQEIGRAHV